MRYMNWSQADLDGADADIVDEVFTMLHEDAVTRGGGEDSIAM